MISHLCEFMRGSGRDFGLVKKYKYASQLTKVYQILNSNKHNNIIMYYYFDITTHFLTHLAIIF